MSWYKSAKSRSGSFTYEFDGIELMNPISFCSGNAEVKFVISRDSGDRNEPPTSDVDLKVKVGDIYCTDAEGDEIPVTDEITKTVEDILSNDQSLRERAFEHEHS
jgi:hypothetical protein